MQVGPAPDDADVHIVVAECNELVRVGLSKLLSGESRYEVLDEVSGFVELAGAVSEHDPHVLVTEVCFGGIHDYSQLEQISDASFGRTRVLVVSHHDEPHVIKDAMRAGACGYLPKNSTVKELHAAVCAVADGGRYLHPRLGGALVEVSAADRISCREGSVVALAAQGLTTSEIADKLLISSRSVESARASARDKLGVTSRAEMYVFASSRGLLPGSCPSAAPPHGDDQ